MLEFIKRTWKDPVGSKLYAAGILAFLGLLVGLVPTLRGWAYSFFQWLNHDTTTPLWVLLIPTIITVFFLSLIIYLRLTRPISTEDEPLTWKTYRKDLFFDILWRWNYNSFDDSILRLNCFCPKCDHQLVGKEDTDSYRVTYGVNFHCPDCNYKTVFKEGGGKDLNDRVIMKIDHNLRAGTWQNSFSEKQDYIELI
jgi:DNA-directed RNA polymerase subunit RPC12/RpoP